MNCVDRVAELVERLETLKRNLLPSLSDTGDYTDQELDRTRGYRLLAHAEIEACVEDMALGVAVDEYDAWFGDRLPRKAIIALTAYYDGNLGGPPETLEELLPGPAEITVRVGTAKDAFALIVSGNNGVRENNVLALLLPVGVGEFDLDSAWLATIDSYGQWRGDTAHRSAGRAQHPPDPATELKTVDVIVKGLQEIAALLDSSQAPQATG